MCCEEVVSALATASLQAAPAGRCAGCNDGQGAMKDRAKPGEGLGTD